MADEQSQGSPTFAGLERLERIRIARAWLTLARHGDRMRSADIRGPGDGVEIEPADLDGGEGTAL